MTDVKLTIDELAALAELGKPDTSGIALQWAVANGISLATFEALAAKGLAEMFLVFGDPAWTITDAGRAALATLPREVSR